MLPPGAHRGGPPRRVVADVIVVDGSGGDGGGTGGRGTGGRGTGGAAGTRRAGASSSSSSSAAAPPSSSAAPPLLPLGESPPVYASRNRPLLFFWNQGSCHWNLVRVQTGLHKSIEVFEPMGKLTSRLGGQHKAGGLSLRSVPRSLIEWLDLTCPLPTADGWRGRTVAAITSQQQDNGFDCGVACLLYAEKCLQGYEKEDVMGTTTQGEISQYRRLLSAYFHSRAAR